jgi:hypothetical protein
VSPPALFLIGMAMASDDRSSDLARYAGIGRYLHEDIAADIT